MDTLDKFAKTKWYSIIIFLIIMLGILFRFYRFSSLGLACDDELKDIYNINIMLDDIKNFNPAGGGHPGWQVWAYPLVFILNGNIATPTIMTLVSVIYGSLAVFCFYLFAKDFFGNDRVAIIMSTLLSSLSIYSLYVSRWSYGTVGGILGQTLFLLFFII